MTLEELKRKKKKSGLTNEEIARRSGVPLGTVQKVFCGATASPRYKTLQALESVLSLSGPVDRSMDQWTAPQKNAVFMVGDTDIPYGEEKTPGAVCETEYVYGASAEKRPEKKQGEYTVQDYLDYPEDQRIELIDGVIYDMAAPTSWHQIVAGTIYNQLMNYVTGKKGRCIPFISPIDVQLDCDERTMVQPDVLIICDKSKLKKGRVFGTPDFVAEVLSPSTRRKDSTTKLAKYSSAGVREYWMVDLKRKQVVVYYLENDALDISLYGFGDKVPVRIFSGECEVDFVQVQNMLEMIAEEDME